MSISAEYVMIWFFMNLAFVCTVCVVGQTVVYIRDCIHDYKLDRQVLDEMREEYRKSIEQCNECLALDALDELLEDD